MGSRHPGRQVLEERRRLEPGEAEREVLFWTAVNPRADLLRDVEPRPQVGGQALHRGGTISPMIRAPWLPPNTRSRKASPSPRAG